MKLGASNYLLKPVSPLKLLKLVRKYALIADEARVTDEIAAMTRNRTFEMKIDYSALEPISPQGLTLGLVR